MADHLAKLADLKSRLGFGDTTYDDDLSRLLKAAASAAERLAGLGDGCLRRPASAVTEYPRGPGDTRQSAVVHLSRKPIESVTSVKQLFSAGSDADFTAADALTENDDFYVDAERGKLERVNSVWYFGPRYLQVVYIGGYADPSLIAVALSAGTWTEATKTLTEAGAFTDYTFTAGDRILITGGTGVTVGEYEVSSRTDANNIVLATSCSTAGADLGTGDITSMGPNTSGSTLILPPAELQEAILDQAVRWWQQKNVTGVDRVSSGQFGGGADVYGQGLHERLVAAAGRERRSLI